MPLSHLRHRPSPSPDPLHLFDGTGDTSYSIRWPTDEPPMHQSCVEARVQHATGGEHREGRECEPAVATAPRTYMLVDPGDLFDASSDDETASEGGLCEEDGGRGPCLKSGHVDYTDPHARITRLYHAIKRTLRDERRATLPSVPEAESEALADVAMDFSNCSSDTDFTSGDPHVFLGGPHVVDTAQDFPYTPILEDTEENLLLSLWRNPRNIFLDHPADPTITPAIVMSPPSSDSWDEYFGAGNNAINPQWPHYLTVPPPSYGYSLTACSPAFTECSAAVEPPLQKSSDAGQMNGVEAATASSTTRGRRRNSHTRFSRARFNELMVRAAREHLVMPHLVSALRRFSHKAAILEAVDESRSRRDLYDSPEWQCAAEKPFSWTDAGTALLSVLRPFRGTIILDSPCPLTAPHIVINEPPPQNPWIAWYNVPNNPQDAGHGALLVVPASGVTIINDPSYPMELASSPLDGHGHSVWENDAPLEDEHMCGGAAEGVSVDVFEVEPDVDADADADAECESRPDSPTPETPQDTPVSLSFDGEGVAFPSPCADDMALCAPVAGEGEAAAAGPRRRTLSV